MDRRINLAMAWCGPAVVVLFVIGLIPLSHFVPPPAPTASAVQIQSFYLENLTGVRIGMVLGIIGMALLLPWSVSVVVQTRRTESVPALSYLQLVCISVSWTTGLLATLVWAVASYRPDDVSAEITRTLNDLGWFLFLFPWPPFAVWFAAVGVAILNDRQAAPVFPRWAGYLSFWAAALIAPGALLVFFKTGAFAFNGFIVFYVAFAAFFAWLLAMTVLVIRAVNATPDESKSEKQSVSTAN